MNKIIISIKPKHVEQILNGKKTIEIRKNQPRDFNMWSPYNYAEVYIYCTKTGVKLTTGSKCLNGKVVGKFIMRRASPIHTKRYGNMTYRYISEYEFDETTLCMKACIDNDDLNDYLGEKCGGYAWLINDLEIFDKPKELSDFGLKRAPQSWCYAKEGE